MKQTYFSETTAMSCNQHLLIYVVTFTPFHQLMESRLYAPGVPTFIISTLIIPPFIMWDPVYPLMPRVMKPCTRQLDHQKEHFNYCLSKSHMTAEHALGYPKACNRLTTCTLK